MGRVHVGVLVSEGPGVMLKTLVIILGLILDVSLNFVYYSGSSVVQQANLFVLCSVPLKYIVWNLCNLILFSSIELQKVYIF